MTIPLLIVSVKPLFYYSGQQETGDNQSLPRGKKKTLHDLFRPPIDLLHKGTFDTVSNQPFLFGI